MSDQKFCGFCERHVPRLITVTFRGASGFPLSCEGCPRCVRGVRDRYQGHIAGQRPLDLTEVRP